MTSKVILWCGKKICSPYGICLGSYGNSIRANYIAVEQMVHFVILCLSEHTIRIDCSNVCSSICLFDHNAVFIFFNFINRNTIQTKRQIPNNITSYALVQQT